MDVGGDYGAAKSGRRGYRVGTSRQVGVRVAEDGRGVKEVGAVPGVEIFLFSGSKVEEEETGVSGLGVESGWEKPFTGAK